MLNHELRAIRELVGIANITLEHRRALTINGGGVSMPVDTTWPSGTGGTFPQRERLTAGSVDALN